MSNYLKDELYQQLGANPALFDFIRESALDGLWFWDIQDPKEGWIDDRFWRTLGYDPAEKDHGASTWQKAVHPEDGERVSEEFREYIKDPEGSFDILVRYIHKEGHTVWTRTRGFLLSNDQGEPIRMLGALSEITDLKRYEELLERASEVAHIGFWEVDVKRNKAFWSKVTREIHEVGPNFMPDVETGINFYRAGESRKKLRYLFNRAIEHGEQYDEELQIITGQNRVKWVRVIGIPEMNQGQCVRMYGLFQDIDFQVNIRQALRSERELYRQVIDGANLGAWEYNMELDEFLVNSRFAEFLGYDYEEFKRLGLSYWFDLIHAEDKAGFIKQVKALDGSGLKGLETELRLARKHKGYSWVVVRAKLFEPSTEFKHRRLVGTIQDISSIKARGEILSKFIHESPLAMAMFDAKMRYISCSKKWYRDYGLNENIIGKSHYKVFPNISEEWKEFHRRSLKGEPTSAEHDFFKLPNGEEHWLRWQIRPWYRDDDKVGGIIMFTENVTEKVIAERKVQDLLRETEERNVRLHNFAHIVSHNLRSNTLGITETLSVLSKERPDLLQEEAFKLSLEAAANLSSTIQDLSEVVEIQGRNESGFSVVDPLKAYQNVVGTFHNQLPTNFKIYIDLQHIPVLKGFPVYMESIFFNLISNAIKYRDQEQKKPYLEISDGIDKKWYWLQFKDNGQGIDLERHQGRVFGMYQTFHEHEEAKGLGLFLVHNQLQMMGGKITVESEPTEGATFTVYLPYEKD